MTKPMFFSIRDGKIYLDEERIRGILSYSLIHQVGERTADLTLRMDVYTKLPNNSVNECEDNIRDESDYMAHIKKLGVENRQLRAALEKIAEVTSYERVNDLRGECISKGNNYRTAYVDTIVNARVIAEDALIMAKAMDAFTERGEDG